MGFLKIIVEKVSWKWLWNTACQHVGYIRNLNPNVHTLMRETSELKRKRENYETEVRDEELIGKKRLRQVEYWFNDADRIIHDTESIKIESEQGTTNFFSQYKLGKRVVEKMEVVKKLNYQGVFPEVAEVPHQLVMSEKMPVPRQLEQQSTSQKTLEEIVQALADAEVGMVSVVGMGGVGKTTLMKQLYNKFTETQCFKVIWVTVSKDFNLQAIQQRIGNKLDMPFHENYGIENRRESLYARLRTMRYMIILDDLWEPFHLEEAGIPHPDEQNGCKIAITTRSMEVSNRMLADKEIRVRTLTSVEAWDLFCSKAGKVVYQPEILPIAEEVVKECGGLPLAIAVMGGAMRGKDRKGLWQNALRALRGVAPADIPGMDQQVFRPLKLSYDYLEDPNIQLCFLYCCLFPEDFQINAYELVNYWICEEGLIDNIDTLEEALNKGLAIVEKLKDASLLEIVVRDEEIFIVKMHDLLRDLAIWITTSPSSSMQASSKFLVNSNGKVPQQDWEGCGRISMMRSCVTQLQFIPNCPDLVLLLLCNIQNLHSIHSTFFQFMPQLRILNLSHTAIQSLPHSFSGVVNLRALILISCRQLVEIPPLGELKELQILDVSNTGIEELPEGISKLVNLKQLNLSHTKALNKIPCNFFSQLTYLQYLRLFGSETMHVSVSTWRELAGLKLLEYLAIDVPDLHSFTSHDVFLIQSFSNCKRFCLLLGKAKGLVREKAILQELCGQNELAIRDFDDLSGGLISIENLMRFTWGKLSLECCDNLASASEIICHSRTLKSLCTVSCKGVKCIIDWREVADTKALDCLKDLYLIELYNLKSIFDGGPPLPSTRFQQLQQVRIIVCPKLKYIFSSSMANHLCQLEFLEVTSCQEVDEIVQGVILHPDDVLPRLRELSLSDLPKLECICLQLPVLKSLKRIKVHACPMLKKLLPLCPATQGIVGYIGGPREWWEGMEWADDHSKSIYSNIFKNWEDEDEEHNDKGKVEEEESSLDQN